MRWKGLFYGALVGACFGRSWLGIILYAWMGYAWEGWWRERKRSRKGNRQRATYEWSDPPAPDPGPGLRSCYRILGAKFGDSDQEVQRKYRDLAKTVHPDILRARGASQREIDAATERMSKINAAWAEIKKERGL